MKSKRQECLCIQSKEYESLKKMIDYIDRSLEYTNGYSKEQFENDMKTVDATVFNISQIGKLVKNISDETKRKYSKIEWNMIKGLRNRIIHDYEGISLKSIWYILENDIIELRAQLNEIIENEVHIHENQKN